jgi:hypothetical protein
MEEHQRQELVEEFFASSGISAPQVGLPSNLFVTTVRETFVLCFAKSFMYLDELFLRNKNFQKIITFPLYYISRRLAKVFRQNLAFHESVQRHIPQIGFPSNLSKQ